MGLCVAIVRSVIFPITDGNGCWLQGESVSVGSYEVWAFSNASDLQARLPIPYESTNMALFLVSSWILLKCIFRPSFLENIFHLIRWYIVHKHGCKTFQKLDPNYLPWFQRSSDRKFGKTLVRNLRTHPFYRLHNVLGQCNGWDMLRPDCFDCSHLHECEWQTSYGKFCWWVPSTHRTSWLIDIASNCQSIFNLHSHSLDVENTVIMVVRHQRLRRLAHILRHSTTRDTGFHSIVRRMCCQKVRLEIRPSTLSDSLSIIFPEGDVRPSSNTSKAVKQASSSKSTVELTGTLYVRLCKFETLKWSRMWALSNLQCNMFAHKFFSSLFAQSLSKPVNDPNSISARIISVVIWPQVSITLIPSLWFCRNSVNSHIFGSVSTQIHFDLPRHPYTSTTSVTIQA